LTHCNINELPKCSLNKVKCTLKKPYTLEKPCTIVELHNVTQTTVCEITCKFCGSKNVVKNGVRTGNIQYYICRDCGRAFAGNNALEGMKYPPEQIASAMSLFYSGLSIDAIRRELNNIYHVYPSDSTVYEWVVRYTQEAIKAAKFSNLKVGSTWIADETFLRVDKNSKGVKNPYWRENKEKWVVFWDIIDADTRFLLASCFSTTRNTQDAKRLMDKAYERAGKMPRVVVTDKLKAYMDGIKQAYGTYTKHNQGSPFAIGNDNNLIERFHATIKARTKVMRGLHNKDSAQLFMDGWLMYYNFFRPHEGLNNKTPAQAAQANFPYKGWKDVVLAGSHRSVTCSST
jgi:putative transposase